MKKAAYHVLLYTLVSSAHVDFSSHFKVGFYLPISKKENEYFHFK